MTELKEIQYHFELHSPDGIRDCFRKGLNPNTTLNGKPLLFDLIGQYTRSSNFKHCIQAFVEFGLRFEDKILLAILLDDADLLLQEIQNHAQSIYRKYNLRVAYTQALEVSLLHICAEFNHINCAAILIKNGLDINIPAGVDKNGFGGQTSIFHTVNQNNNQSVNMMDFLLSNDAKLDIELKGLIWGKDYEWETFIPSVNPISYAMMGLLPQMHRKESTIASIVKKLIYYRYGIEYTAENIPNKYLLK